MTMDDDVNFIDGVQFTFADEQRRVYDSPGTNMDDNARRILADARATLERTANIKVEPIDYLALAMSRPVTDPVARDLAAIAKQERHFARQREREAQRNAREAARAARTPAAIDWGEVDRRCRAVAKEMILACAREVADALREERAAAKRELSAEVKRLRVEITAADETIAELRRTIDAGKRSGEIIDITPARRVN
jgi:hypothetical protein